MIASGRLNLITDVPGLRVGNAEDLSACTGVSVVLCDRPGVAAVDIRGGAPGTRETDALAPGGMVEGVDAIVLSGGSVFGLEAASTVTNALAARGRGMQVAAARVPIVPSAILFDLHIESDKHWGENPPYRALAKLALSNANSEFRLGNAGAGFGATAGFLKGGLGSASLRYRGEQDFSVGALAAVNASGSPVIPDTPLLWAWPFERDGELGDQARLLTKVSFAAQDLDYAFDKGLGSSTTLAVVATDLPLTKIQAQRVAIMAQDGLAHALRPVHTPFDGDCVFVLSTAKPTLSASAKSVARLGMLAADCVARAVGRGVYEASSLGEWTAYRDLYAEFFHR